MLTLFIISILIAAVALAFGWLVCLSDAAHPTAGDVLRGTLRSSGIPAIIIILLMWAMLLPHY